MTQNMTQKLKNNEFSVVIRIIDVGSIPSSSARTTEAIVSVVFLYPKEVTMHQRTVSYSKSEQVHIVQPADLNAGGRLFGGTLLKMIDELAAIVAMRHAGVKTVTTAAIDNLVFKSGAYVGDMIVLIGYITHTGRTSMEVRVDTYVEKNDGMRYPINRAYMVLVAMDENNRPTTVPPIILENEFQEEEYRLAEKRRALRLERNKGGF